MRPKTLKYPKGALVRPAHNGCTIASVATGLLKYENAKLVDEPNALKCIRDGFTHIVYNRDGKELGKTHHKGEALAMSRSATGYGKEKS